MTRSALALLAAVLPGCPEPGAGWEYPRDDVLRIDQIRAVGTHNSYHVAPESTGIEELDYTHADLQVQLRDQGVRQFELDVWWNDDTAAFDVRHILVIDEGTTCATLGDCLSRLKGWSDGHPAHHPLFLLIEPKDGFDPDRAGFYLDVLDSTLLAAWPRERLVTPADVQGDHSSLREAVALGWPTLGEGRGRLVVQLHDGGDLASFYASGGTDLRDRPMFTNVGPESDLAAFVAINDPIADFDRIQAAVQAGIVVRTRADETRADFEDGPTPRRDAALDSGAHLVSTDHPTPDAETGYVVHIPGGTPSGCNPLVAASDCAPEDIEDPAFVGG